MENTDDTLTDLATLDTLDAVRRNHAQRLLDMAEALLQGFEALAMPKDAAGFDRAGKALLTLNKVMDTLHTQARSLAHRAKVEVLHNEADGKPAPDPAEKFEMVKIYRAAQALRLEAVALRRATGQGAAGQIETKSAVSVKSPRHHWPRK